MRTAIDTNVLSAIWSREETGHDMAEELGKIALEGGLVISAPVYAELLAHPNATKSFVNAFLEETGITIDFELEKSTWIEAADRFARYAARRRKSTGQTPKRLLADFIIGSHALLQADRFMTLDPKRYEQDFRELKRI